MQVDAGKEITASPVADAISVLDILDGGVSLDDYINQDAILVWRGLNYSTLGGSKALFSLFASYFVDPEEIGGEEMSDEMKC